jgi:hypothetical protein
MGGDVIPYGPSVADRLANPTTRFPLRRGLRNGPDHDPVDAAHDAACGVEVFDQRVGEAVACTG